MDELTGNQLAVLATIIRKTGHLLVRTATGYHDMAAAAFQRGDGGPLVLTDAEVLPITLEIAGMRITLAMQDGVTTLQINNPRLH